MKLFLRGIFLVLLSVLLKNADAQSVNYQSGFYQLDSLFFKVDRQAPAGGKVEVSVNCFTGACFNEYKNGIWLYNRNNTPNTWENQQFSRAPTGAVDTIAPRGSLDKVNVVRVRIKQANGSIVSDSVYFIGLIGKNGVYPYKVPVVQLFVDSMDAFGPLGFYGPGEGVHTEYVNVWNYELDQTPVYNTYIPRSRVEKACAMQLIDTHMQPVFYQNCGIHVSGLESRSLPNKSLVLVARDEYTPHTSTFKTSLFEHKPADYDILRLRTGGSGQVKGFGAHEIGERVIMGLHIGEVPVEPVITFLNGSYWSLAFAQTSEIDYAAKSENMGNEISELKPLYFERTPKFSTKIKNMKIDDSKIVWSNVNGSDKVIASGLLIQGKKDLFEPVSAKIINANEGKTAPLTFTEIDNLLDVNSWLTYIAVVDFGRIQSSIDHHIYMCTAPGKKVFVLMDQIQDFAEEDPKGNHWKEQILGSNEADGDGGEKSMASVIIRNILLKNKTCIEKLCLRYQDLLNTAFKPERTVPIVDNIAKEMLPEYGRYWRSWNPNAGRDSVSEAGLMESIKSFCKERPNVAWQQIAEQWLPSDTLHLSDRKAVHVVMDSVPAGTVKVHLNSLVITQNWDGLYYPDPALELSMEPQNVPAGYVLEWKEYVGKPLSFKLPAKGPVTLTPVLRPAGKKSR